MKKLYKLSVLAVGITLAGSALALDPAPVDLGGFQMIPTLSLTTGQDDNPFSQNDSDNPDSMMVTTVAPKVQFLAQNQDNVYSVDLGLVRGIFHDSTDDNYTDFNINGAARLVLNSRNALDLSAGYLDGHEDRGSGATQGAIGDALGLIGAGPTEYHDTTLGGKYTFGAASAKARVEFSADYLRKVFDNLEEINSVRDRRDFTYGARLLYAIGPDTDLTAEIKQKDSAYITNSSLDSTDTGIFVGAEWQATAKTSGFAKVGWSDKDFDDSSRRDADGEANWDIGITWEPRTYSSVTLQTSRDEEETTGTGDYIDTTSYEVSWNHVWTEQVATDLSYSIREEEYVASNQDDDTDMIRAKITYAFDRWLDIGLAWEYTDKSTADSALSALEYDRNMLS